MHPDALQAGRATFRNLKRARQLKNHRAITNNAEKRRERHERRPCLAQIAALGPPPDFPPAPPPTAAPDAFLESLLAAPPPSLEPAFPAAPNALAETAEYIEAQIAALGLPPDFSPAPPPVTAPDAFLESLLASAPPAPPVLPQARGDESLKDKVAETIPWCVAPPRSLCRRARPCWRCWRSSPLTRPTRSPSTCAAPCRGSLCTHTPPLLV